MEAYTVIKGKFRTVDHTTGLLSHAKFGPDWLKGLLGAGGPEIAKICHNHSILVIFCQQGRQYTPDKIWHNSVAWVYFCTPSLGHDGRTEWVWRPQISKFGKNCGILAFFDPQR